MALTQREKMIALATGGAVVLLALQSTVIGPFMARSEQVDKDIDQARRETADRGDLFARRSRLQKVWDDLKRGGLSGDVPAAESQTANALYTWIQSARVAPVSLLPDRSTTEKEFQVSGYRFTGTGSTPAVAQLLWDIETAHIPVRLTDVQLGPRKEGSDELTAQLSISTLTTRQPDPKQPAAAAAAATPTEDRS